MIYMETKLVVHPGKMGKYQEVEKDMYSFIAKALRSQKHLSTYTYLF